MRTIAVIVNDNDFGMTFYPMLEAVKNALQWIDGEQVTPELVTHMIKDAVPFYVKYTQGEPGIEGITTCEYLLNKIKILFDEEAEKDIMDPNALHDGGAWYLDLQTDIIKSY